MRQNPQNQPSASSERIKHLFLEADGIQKPQTEYSPYYYAEVRIDFNDVRTGYRSTVSLNKAIELRFITPDLLWVEDMIREIDPLKAKPSAPDNAILQSLPEFVNMSFMAQTETQFIHYLLRSYKLKIFRNFDLGIYSDPGESQADFVARCSDLLDEPKRRELDALHDVVDRKLEQIKQKYMKTNVPDSLEVAKAESQDKNLFFGYSDRISGLFMNPGIGAEAPKKMLHVPGNNPDLEDRLECLEVEVEQAIAGIRDSYARKTQSIDEYILHPNLKDIHFVRCCILWIPARIA